MSLLLMLSCLPFIHPSPSTLAIMPIATITAVVAVVATTSVASLLLLPFSERCGVRGYKNMPTKSKALTDSHHNQGSVIMEAVIMLMWNA